MEQTHGGSPDAKHLLVVALAPETSSRYGGVEDWSRGIWRLRNEGFGQSLRPRRFAITGQVVGEWRVVYPDAVWAQQGVELEELPPVYLGGVARRDPPHPPYSEV